MGPIQRTSCVAVIVMAGAYAQAQQAERPLEPRTEASGERWYEQAWTTSTSALPKVPGTLGADLKDAGQDYGNMWRSGVSIGDFLVVGGLPGTAETAREHSLLMRSHYGNAFGQAPQHLRQVGVHYRAAHSSAQKTAQDNLDDTRKTADEQQRAIDTNVKERDTSLEQTDDETGAAQRRVLADGRKAIDETIDLAAQRSERAAQDGRDDTTMLVTSTKDSARLLGIESFRGAMEMGGWTLEATRRTALGTRDWTLRAAAGTRDGMLSTSTWGIDAAGESLDNLDAELTRSTAWGEHRRADVHASLTQRGAQTSALIATWQKEIVAGTFAQIPGVGRYTLKAADDDARALWKAGYDEHLRGGLRLAGDNLFAGDVEGLLMGGFYSTAALVQGGAFVFILEPVVLASHVAAGALRSAALATSGAGLTVGLQASRFVASIGMRAVAIGIMAAVASGTVLHTAFTGLNGCARTGGLALAGLALTTGMMLGGAAFSVASLVGGTSLTLATAAVGSAATVLLPTLGLGVGEAAVGTRALVGATGTAIKTVAGTTLPWAAAGTMSAVHTTGVGLEVAALRTRQAAHHIILPTTTFISNSARVGWLLAVAAFNNLLASPAAITWLFIVASGASAWELVSDPVLGTWHLVLGAGGFAIRLAGLTSLSTAIIMAQALKALAIAGATLIHYGGMATISGSARAFEAGTAPLRFDLQNRWRDERMPQLQQMLDEQSEDVRGRVGTRVRYLRTVWSGPDRGKVLFFRTEERGNDVRFDRKVRADCHVVYRGSDGTEIESGRSDADCVEQQQGSAR